MKQSKKDIKMVIDYELCVSVPRGDERLNKQGVPYSCKECIRDGFENGVLVFPGDPIPVCSRRHWNRYTPDPLTYTPS